MMITVSIMEEEDDYDMMTWVMRVIRKMMRMVRMSGRVYVRVWEWQGFCRNAGVAGFM